MVGIGKIRWSLSPNVRTNQAGSFQATKPVTDRKSFTGNAQYWWEYENPSTVIDINNDKYPDVVHFGRDGVYVSMNNKNGTFGAPVRKLYDFGYSANGWQTDKSPRTLADVNNDGYPDIVGFGAEGVYVALNNKTGGFNAGALKLSDLGTKQGWREDKFPRMIG